MLVVNSREFIEKQTAYLNQVDKGAEILIRRGKNRSYKITPVVKDDTLMSEEELLAIIKQGRQDAKDGKGILIKTKEDLKAYFQSL